MNRKTHETAVLFGCSGNVFYFRRYILKLSMLYSELSNMLQTAVRAAIEAGRAIMQVYALPAERWEVERKADESPLTLADRRAHAIIADRLAPLGLPLLSEEGSHTPFDERTTWHEFWLVDPLDGTKEFLKKNGEFTVNIALIEHGEPTFGVVYAPALAALYVGAKGMGAAVWTDAADESALLRAPQSLPLEGGHEGLVVVASRSHLSPETGGFIEKLRLSHSDVRTLAAGSSLKLCRVAEGSADLYPRFAPTMEWDTAAGDAIVRASGGSVCQADDGEAGDALIYNKADLHNPWFLAQAPKTIDN